MKMRHIASENRDAALQVLQAVEQLQALAENKVNLREVAGTAATAFEYTIPDYHDGNPGDYSWEILSEWFLHKALGGLLPKDVHLYVLNQSLLDLPEVVVLYLMKRDGIDWDTAATVVSLMAPFDFSTE